MPATLEEARRHLSVLARRNAFVIPRGREDMPCRWHPNTVKDPTSEDFLTELGARELISDLLDKNHPMEEVPLNNPPGKLAYVILVDGGIGRPRIYIKLQLGRGQIIARSFHYSDFG